MIRNLQFALALAALFPVLVGCGSKSVVPNIQVAGHRTNSLGMVLVQFARPAIAVGIWETRVQDFAAFVTDTGYAASVGMLSLNGRKEWTSAGRTWRDPGFAQDATHPVVGVSWNDANAFCRWLTKKEQAAGWLTTNQMYRLPTDEEWSLAVGLPPETGTSPWAKGRYAERQRSGRYLETRGMANESWHPLDVYPWGTAWPPPTNAGNYAADLQVDAFPFTAPVGSFAPNQLGIYDLGGNVWEWCADRIEPQTDQRVWRGASFIREPIGTYLAFYSTTRVFDVNSACRADLGFRIVLATTATN